MGRIRPGEPPQAEGSPPGGLERRVTSVNQRVQIAGSVVGDDHHGPLRRLERFFAVTQSVRHRDQDAVRTLLYEVLIARNHLTGQWAASRGPLDQRVRVGTPRPLLCVSHFLSLTVVPLPTMELISNSSIKRRAPGRPMPRLRVVE